MIDEEKNINPAGDLAEDMPEQEVTNTEDKVEEDEEEVLYECGMLIRSELNGGGIRMDGISNECAREATNEDFLMLILRAHAHILSNITMAKTMNEIMRLGNQQKIMKPKMGIHPATRR